ncbi:conjugal transfer protein TrbF [Brevundimonas diminuta]|uniref:Conjugal transfer protein n=1 Tax=Brevundimonas naejangsanensis TaxID=588932 RepID=A0A172Y4F1_9CAUL|nr:MULTISPECIES: conjugal transfer protein TrbF [Brevundimonas]ANF54087.1 conjugal transfer protein [Brevundimonas naejangsanensis]MCO8029891.1 conjugal transfer protein TrbF [Brevundimonas diminuta]
MHPFFKPRRALSAAPASTPYQRAGQVWDERMGLTLAHARNWRRMAFANLALAAFLGAGWWVQADRAVVKPFVVEVSDWGETQRITAIGGRYQPSEAQIGHALGGWIRDVRSKSIDPIVIRQNWLRAYDLMTPRAAAFLNAWAQAHDPFAEVGREAVNVEVLNVVRRTERTYDLQWRESRFVNGQQAGSERWRALITTGLQPPRTEAELMKNPLGLKIEDVSWTPDAS